MLRRSAKRRAILSTDTICLECTKKEVATRLYGEHPTKRAYHVGYMRDRGSKMGQYQPLIDTWIPWRVDSKGVGHYRHLAKLESPTDDRSNMGNLFLLPSKVATTVCDQPAFYSPYKRHGH